MELRGLGKGANAPVNGDSFTVVVGSSVVDVLAFQLSADGRVRSDADVVFYNQSASPEGAVRLTAPGTVTVLLDLVPASVATVSIAVTAADDAATSTLSRGLDITLTSDLDGFRWPVEGLAAERAAILAELYRRNGGWKLRNVSAGWEQGLPALFTHFGVAVDEGAGTPVVSAPPAPPVPLTRPPMPPPVPLAPPMSSTLPPVPVAPVVAPTNDPGPLASNRRKGSAKKRIAWAAAVLVAVLVAVGILGRTTSSKQSTTQPIAAAAPLSTSAPSSTAALPTTTGSAASSPSTSMVPTSATVQPTITPALAAQPLLAAPPAIDVVRTAVAAQAAATTLRELRVAGRAPKTGYSRAQFGQAWTDDTTVDSGHNGCDTRNDVLRRDLREVTVRAGSHGCAVTSGTFTDPYTAKALAFSSSKPTAVQIDHVVALSNAWQTGAAVLTPQRRQDLANDPLNLQATAGAVNQAKSDGDAATWLPPDKSYRCTYVARQVAVKARYGLWVTAAERQAIATVLTACGASVSPGPTPKPTPARSPQTTPGRTTTAIAPPTTAVQQLPVQTTSEPVTTMESSTKPVPTTPVATTPDDASVYYKNCTEAKAAGVTPLRSGDPGYRSQLDGDHDGVACES